MENNNEKIEAAISSNPYRLAIHQGVHVTPAPLGKICGIYQELTPGVYQIFLNDQLIEDNHDMCDRTIYILMNHHNSDKRGNTKVVTVDDMNLFKKVMEDLRKYEQKIVDAFLKTGLNLSSIFRPQN